MQKDNTPVTKRLQPLASSLLVLVLSGSCLGQSSPHDDLPGFYPPHEVGDLANIPPSVQKAIQQLHPGMTRKELDQQFASFHVSYGLVDYNGISNEIVSGPASRQPYPRMNPQPFYYRFAYSSPPNVDTTHWVFTTKKAIQSRHEAYSREVALQDLAFITKTIQARHEAHSRDAIRQFMATIQDEVCGSEDQMGTHIAIDVTRKYTDHYRRKMYRHVQEDHQDRIFAPVYDAVAGGSPDDVVTHISEPYFTYDSGNHT